jgi:hypothetical protein
MDTLKDRNRKSKGSTYWKLLTGNVSCFLWQQIYLLNPFDKEAARQAKQAFQRQLRKEHKKGNLLTGRAKRQRTAPPVEEAQVEEAQVEEEAQDEGGEEIEESDSGGGDGDAGNLEAAVYFFVLSNFQFT